MKTLSSYKDKEAIELWADLLEPMQKILTDKKIREEMSQKGNTVFGVAKTILKAKPTEAIEILLRIDDTAIDGLNLIIRLAAFLTEIGENEDAKAFFGFAEQKTE